LCGLGRFDTSHFPINPANIEEQGTGDKKQDTDWNTKTSTFPQSINIAEYVCFRLEEGLGGAEVDPLTGPRRVTWWLGDMA
jgi:hypothetical protein